MPLDSVSAQMMLLKCQGDEIWNVETCRSAGVPEDWIEELLDRFESGYDSDRNTIYHENKMVNQYEGVSDLKLLISLPSIWASIGKERVPVRLVGAVS